MEWVSRTIVWKYYGPYVLAGVVLLGALLFWLLWTPITGTLAVTVISEDGAVRAATVDVRTLSVDYYPLSNPQTALIAAVPSPTGVGTAYLTRTREKVMRVSVSTVESADIGAVAAVAPTASVPQWSKEGTSIAFSTQASTTSAPESWTVLRAVKSGDALTVGRGARPYPSPNQRTYALTSRGIALLSYSDVEPTVVVASPVPVPVSTPFAVSQDGMRAAWVAPADKSLQVFENVNGYFVPIALIPGVALQTLVFSPDGKYLIGGEAGDDGTVLKVVHIRREAVSVIGSVPGFLELHAWRYEN